MKTILTALAVSWTILAVGSGQSFAAALAPATADPTAIVEWCNDYKGH